MKYKQNFKIMQITDKTLVIGVDIAKRKHFARAFDWRGIELDKTINFKSNWTGFNKFLDWAKEVAEREDKEKIVVGLEPTGHYWLTFAQVVLDELCTSAHNSSIMITGVILCS
jgi:transposase